MKKNKMMRIASVLLVAVLLSTCAISGTFAKYVTTDSGSDSARVAKFAFTVSENGTDFTTTDAEMYVVKSHGLYRFASLDISQHSMAAF